MSSSSEAARLDFGPVLARAAAELEAQAAAVDAMHALAEADGEGGAPARGEALRAAQSIDVVAQHLRALAGVLAGMAATAPDGAALPPGVIEAVTLSDLAARLRGETATGADDGDFELL